MTGPTEEDAVLVDPAPSDGPPLHPDDASLVRGFLAGDSSAYRTIRGWLVRYVRYSRFNIPAEEQKDIVGKAIEGLLESLRERRFEGRARLETFSKRIALHKIQDFWKGFKRRKQIPLPEDPPYVDPSPRPPEVLEQEEFRERLKKAFKALPERCRELIRLRALEERPWPHKKTAKLFGVKAALVGYWLHQCRRRLAELLAE